MRRFLLGGALALLLVSGALAQETQPILTGDTGIHDPSIIEVDGGYIAFATGFEGGLDRGAIRLKTSPDGVAWSDAGALGKGLPEWVEPELTYKPRNIWAPSISKHGDTWYLYYSVSSFGINFSAIGLMTNEALTLENPAEGWVDQGLVISSNGRDNFNAIDPARIDSADGSSHLVFGSYWDGLRLAEIDPVSGKPSSDRPELVRIATRFGAGIEAPSIIFHDGFYYLFASFDQCCKSLSSTYRIMVGRSEAVDGPYLDKSGTKLLQGGGTELLATTGRFIGPGGQEALRTSKGDMLVYHYYDGAGQGVPKLQFSPLIWGEDGWPELGPLPQEF